LKDVLKELTDIFSAQKLSFDYLGFDLKWAIFNKTDGRKNTIWTRILIT
jgi:hypothetical protein